MTARFLKSHAPSAIRAFAYGPQADVCFRASGWLPGNR